MKKLIRFSRALVIFSIVLLDGAGVLAGATAQKTAPPVNPDFIKGGQRDDFHDWTLGPTGLRGWIFGSKCETSEARQILFTLPRRIAVNFAANFRWMEHLNK